MYTGKTLFAQLMDFLPWTTFARIVERYGGDRYVKSLRCAEHFRVMAFAQLTELSPNFGDGLKIRRRLEARQKCR
jgi:hypothetical protein